MNGQSTNSREEGVRLLQAGNFEGALLALQRAVAENPEDGTIHGYLGICHARLGDLNASIAALQEAARLRSNDAGAQYNLGVALIRAQRVPEARAELGRALDLAPDHDRARAALQSLGPEATPSVAPPPPSVSIPPKAQPTPPVAAPWETPTSPPPSPGLVSQAPPVLGPERSQGMVYTPQTAIRVAMHPPGTGLRVGRGLLWGWVYGQWWTLWTIISMIIWGGLSSGKVGGLGSVLFAILCVLVFGFFGSVTGLIIGLANPDPGTGMSIGIGVGIAVCVLQVLLVQGSWFNLFFYFITGRYVGLRITARVIQPVER